jgi:hypothetical protein
VLASQPVKLGPIGVDVHPNGRKKQVRAPV